MKYPTIKKTGKKVYTFDDFSGGVNSTEEKAKILDTQISDCLNFDVLGSSLVMRKTFNAKNGSYYISNFTGAKGNAQTYLHKVRLKNTGEYVRIGALVYETVRGYDVKIFLLKKNGELQLTQLFSFDNAFPTEYRRPEKFFFLEGKKKNGCGLYLFMLINKEERGIVSETIYKYELGNDFSTWHTAAEDSFEIPTVLVNGRGNKYYEREDYENICGKEIRMGTKNILGGGFNAKYYSDGYSDNFPLPYNNIDSDKSLKVSVYSSNEYHVDWIVPSGESYSDTVSYYGHNLKVRLNRTTGVVYFEENGHSVVFPCNNVANDLSITAYKTDDSLLSEIIRNKTGEIDFESRIFVSTKIGNENRIYYFDNERITYLSEDFYFTVGDARAKVTALSTQSKYLFVFKESEIHRVTFTEKTSSNSYRFFDREVFLYDKKLKSNTTLVNGGVGCDFPDTLALCGNRLVWLNKSGSVMTLYGSNLYSDGNIYDLSFNVKEEIIKELNNGKPFAVSYAGNYYLSVGEKMFVMDGLSRGFSLPTGYGKVSSGNGPKWVIFAPCEYVRFEAGFCDADKPVYITRTDSLYNRGVYATATLDSAETDEYFFAYLPEGGEIENTMLMVVSSFISTKAVELPEHKKARVNFSAVMKCKEKFVVSVFDGNDRLICKRDFALLRPFGQFREYSFSFTTENTKYIYAKIECISGTEISKIVFKIN